MLVLLGSMLICSVGVHGVSLYLGVSRFDHGVIPWILVFLGQVLYLASLSYMLIKGWYILTHNLEYTLSMVKFMGFLVLFLLVVYLHSLGKTPRQWKSYELPVSLNFDRDLEELKSLVKMDNKKVDLCKEKQLKLAAKFKELPGRYPLKEFPPLGFQCKDCPPGYEDLRSYIQILRKKGFTNHDFLALEQEMRDIEKLHNELILDRNQTSCMLKDFAHRYYETKSYVKKFRDPWKDLCEVQLASSCACLNTAERMYTMMIGRIRDQWENLSFNKKEGISCWLELQDTLTQSLDYGMRNWQAMAKEVPKTTHGRVFPPEGRDVNTLKIIVLKNKTVRLQQVFDSFREALTNKGLSQEIIIQYQSMYRQLKESLEMSFIDRWYLNAKVGVGLRDELVLWEQALMDYLNKSRSSLDPTGMDLTQWFPLWQREYLRTQLANLEQDNNDMSHLLRKLWLEEYSTPRVQLHEPQIPRQSVRTIVTANTRGYVPNKGTPTSRDSVFDDLAEGMVRMVSRQVQGRVDSATKVLRSMALTSL